MKALKLILGTLAALWTVGVVIGFVPTLLSGDFSTQGITEIAAGCGVIAICGLITYWLFESALRKKQEDATPSKSAEDGNAD